MQLDTKYIQAKVRYKPVQNNEINWPSVVFARGTRHPGPRLQFRGEAELIHLQRQITSPGLLDIVRTFRCTDKLIPCSPQ